MAEVVQAATALLSTIIVAFFNNKGGVGKTTSTIFIAYSLALKGYRVCVIDMDPQANCTFSLLGKMYKSMKDNICEALIGIDGREPRPIWELVQPTRHKNLFVVPGSIYLQKVEQQMISWTGREFILANRIKPLRGYFHFVLIDTPPSLGVLTENALMASSYHVVVVYLKIYALIGIDILLDRIKELRESFGQFGYTFPRLGVLITQVRRTKNADERRAQIKDMFPDTFIAEIPQNEVLEVTNDPAKLDSEDESPFEYEPNAPGMIAYRGVGNEMLERLDRYVTTQGS